MRDKEVALVEILGLSEGEQLEGLRIHGEEVLEDLDSEVLLLGERAPRILDQLDSELV